MTTPWREKLSPHDNIASGMVDEEAADAAIERCIEEGYIAEYLKGKRGEAKDMLLNFDENDLEESMKEEREEGRKEGREEGKSILSDTIRKLSAGRSAEELISSGIDEGTVKMAIEARNAVLAMS